MADHPHPTTGLMTVPMDPFGLMPTESLAPDWSVPPEVCPFVHLPILKVCRGCGEPLRWSEVYTAVSADGTHTHTPLCRTCAGFE